MIEQKIPEDLWNEFEREQKNIKDFDVSKLQLSPENNKSLDTFFKKFLDPNEVFPDGARHTMIEKNLAIYVVKNKIDIKTLKKVYQSKKFNFNSLLSQIKGVTSGTYGDDPNVNIGELINWCKQFRPDIINILVTEKKENPFKKLHYSTTHLPYFHEFMSITGLYGRQYIPILKARYYQLLGGIIQRKIHLGKLYTDTRMHIAYPLPTEAGKNDLIYSIKELIKRGIKKRDEKNFTMSVPTSYHPEQLIGKYIEITEEKINEDTGRRKKIKKRIENRGHLNNDFLEFDECTSLITSTKHEHQEAREKLSTAENPIGRNEIEKRLVEDTPENVVRYCPEGTHSYYFQPFKKIPEEAFLQGFLRRKLIPVGNVGSFLNFADESLFSDKINSVDYSRSDYVKRIKKFLEEVRTFSNKDLDIFFDNDASDLIIKYSLQLLAQGKIHSNKIANLCKIAKYSTLSYLVKMSAIISFAYGKQVVDKNAVSLAYMDLVELLQNTYDFIAERTYGDFSYGTSWGGANYKEKMCLQYLQRHKALTKEVSGISIADFKDVIKEIFEVKDTRATEILSQMKRSDLVDTAQIGQTETKVWMKFNPKLQQEEAQGLQGYEGYTSYNYVFQHQKAIVSLMEGL